MNERRRYQFVLEAATPLAHHAEAMGNEAIIMRRKLRTAHGGWAYVPAVSGDAMRHGLREAAAYAFLDAAGMLSDATASLSEGALRLLFSGGMVTGRGDGGTVRLDAYRELCAMVPHMAIFGGCAGNRIISGRLQVEDATLICDESRRFVPEWAVAVAEAYGGGALESGRAHVEEVQRVRMDPCLSPEKRTLMAPEARQSVDERMLASAEASEDDDEAGREATKSSIMPRRYERLAQGSLLYWACEATCCSELDVDAFHVALGVFLADAVVGGKRGTGHGRLRAVEARQIDLVRQRDASEVLDIGALGPAVGETFRRHVQARAEEVRTFLVTVNA